MRTSALSGLMVVVGLGLGSLGVGCTFGQGTQERFVARGLVLEGDFGEDRQLKSTEGSVNVTQWAEDAEGGVLLELRGSTGDRSPGAMLRTDLRVDGNLASLCPGSRLELESREGTLVTSRTYGIPDDLRGDASELSLTMRSEATFERSGDPEHIVATGERLELSAQRNEDSELVRVSFAARARTRNGDRGTIAGSFDMGTVEDDGELAGWD